MDFVGPFPLSSRGYDMVFTVVDRFLGCVVLCLCIVLLLLLMLLICSLRIGYVSMVYLVKLLVIEIVNLHPISGNHLLRYYNVN